MIWKVLPLSRRDASYLLVQLQFSCNNQPLSIVQVNWKVANRVHRGENATMMRAENAVFYSCLKAHKGLPCFCCSVRAQWYLRHPDGLEHQSCHMQVFFVAYLRAASSCPKTKCRSSKVIVAFMDPL